MDSTRPCAFTGKLGIRQAKRTCASLHLSLGELDAAQGEFQDVVDLRCRIGQTRSLARARLLLGQTERGLGNRERAHRECLAALELFSQFGDAKGEAETLEAMRSIDEP